jgi:hypothetical protein
MFGKLTMLLVLLLVLVGAAAAQDDASRTFEPLDRGLAYQFEYPIATHSVRTSNLAEPANFPVVFGGLVAVEPNDATIYAAEAAPTHFTRMRVLANAHEELVDAEGLDLTRFVGALPLLSYDPALATITETTLGGQPALRVSVPYGPEGTEVIEIISHFDGLIYQIVIEPVPLGLGFQPDVAYVIDPTYETILDSWVFTPLPG